MAQHAATPIARCLVFPVCLTISSAVALPALGDPISFYECTPAQARSPEGLKCIDQSEKDLINKAPKYRALYCKGSDMTCCITDIIKPNKPISDCNYLGQVPPCPPSPSCKSIDENYHKAVQALTEAQQH